MLPSCSCRTTTKVSHKVCPVFTTPLQLQILNSSGSTALLDGKCMCNIGKFQSIFIFGQQKMKVMLVVTPFLFCNHVYLSLPVVHLLMHEKSMSSMRHNRGTIYAYAWLLELPRADSLKYVQAQLVWGEYL